VAWDLQGAAAGDGRRPETACWHARLILLIVFVVVVGARSEDVLSEGPPAERAGGRRRAIGAGEMAPVATARTTEAATPARWDAGGA
jgi:hypothetical protein